MLSYIDMNFVSKDFQAYYLTDFFPQKCQRPVSSSRIIES